MTMYQDYFELLDIDRSLPAWAYVKKIHDARIRFEREFEGELPDQVKAAMVVFGQPEGKADYDELLRLSSMDAVEISQDNIARLKSVAEFTHFTLEVLTDSTCRVTRRSIELSSAQTIDADPTPSLKLHRVESTEPAASPPAPSGPATQTQPRGEDSYGRRNGRIPPLVLGTRVYQWAISVPQYLSQVIDLGECYQLVWEEDDGHTYSHNDFLGPSYGPNFYNAGATYRHIQLQDTQAGRWTTEAIYSVNAEQNGLTVSGSGIYGNFPWYAKFLPVKRGVSELQYKWNKANQIMPMPPIDYFGKNQWSKPVIDCFIHYIREVYYWGYCYMDGFQTPGPRIRQIAGGDAKYMLENVVSMKRKDMRRNGL